MASSFKTKVIILAGGLGTRLRSVVNDVPKVLAPVEGKPFLSVMLKWLKKNDVRHVTLSLGYMAEQVVSLIPALEAEMEMTIEYVIETVPRGTLGGLSLVFSKYDFEDCIVINGDTFVDIDLQQFYMTHQSSSVDMALALTSVIDPTRYGTVTLQNELYIKDFIEKGQSETDWAWINAGIYYLSRPAITEIMSINTGSIETNFFAKQFERLGYSTFAHAKFIDIGTPESYDLAEKILKEYL